MDHIVATAPRYSAANIPAARWTASSKSFSSPVLVWQADKNARRNRFSTVQYGVGRHGKRSRQNLHVTVLDLMLHGMDFFGGPRDAQLAWGVWQADHEQASSVVIQLARGPHALSKGSDSQGVRRYHVVHKGRLLSRCIYSGCVKWQECERTGCAPPDPRLRFDQSLNRNIRLEYFQSWHVLTSDLWNTGVGQESASPRLSRERAKRFL